MKAQRRPALVLLTRRVRKRRGGGVLRKEGRKRPARAGLVPVEPRLKTRRATPYFLERKKATKQDARLFLPQPSLRVFLFCVGGSLSLSSMNPCRPADSGSDPGIPSEAVKELNQDGRDGARPSRIQRETPGSKTWRATLPVRGALPPTGAHARRGRSILAQLLTLYRSGLISRR